ncbi:mediator of RNA polymerase II transcription subunit 12 [Eurosta solidaginis]|uniref:mediator of RNA polymerase II transcription subunit 12 n=1 Tax=Eurosta solidaginis TaxID=178769 RepID=UPI0035306C53
MRAFITLCILATAYSKPQGYSYQNQQSSYKNQQNSYQANSISSGQQYHSNSIASVAPSFLQEALKNPKVSQSLIGAPTTNYIPPPAGASFPHKSQHQQGFQPSLEPLQPHVHNSYAPQQQQYQQQGGYAQSAALVTKDIYVHVAPEEHEEQQYQRPVLPPPPPRKHYRIVFIKAPTQKINKAAVHVNQVATEEKTIIYVLTRKPDPIDFEAAYQEAAAPKQPSKPEVYFIKYRTQEEAQHAQQTIQAQYDQLGGTTQVSDEGVAPVTSVIGSLDQQNGSAGANIGHSNGGISSNGASSSSSSGSYNSGASGVNSQYLPPIRL